MDAAAARVIDSYRARIESRTGDDGEVELARLGEAFERELRVAGLMAERTELFRDLRNGNLGSATAHKLIREIDLLKARHSG